MEEIFDGYVTKYALTEGVQKKKLVGTRGEGLVHVVGESYPYYHGEGREWHRTRESALEQAEKMRKKKIASLKKQIAKLEKLNFEQQG